MGQLYFNIVLSQKLNKTLIIADYFSGWLNQCRPDAVASSPHMYFFLRRCKPYFARLIHSLRACAKNKWAKFWSEPISYFVLLFLKTPSFKNNAYEVREECYYSINEQSVILLKSKVEIP